MNLIRRWLEKRRARLEILVMDAVRESRTSGQTVLERDIVRQVKSSWPDELDHKPLFIIASEIASAFDRLVGRGELSEGLPVQHYSATETFSSRTFAFPT